MYVNVHINIKYKGKDVDVTPILLHDKTRGMSFFQCLYIELMVVEGQDEDWVAKLENNLPIMFTVDDCEGFYDKVGKNTSYIFHPEEVLATCFQMSMQSTEFITQWVEDELINILNN